jgi:hypothetical protein
MADITSFVKVAPGVDGELGVAATFPAAAEPWGLLELSLKLQKTHALVLPVSSHGPGSQAASSVAVKQQSLTQLCSHQNSNVSAIPPQG